MNFKDGTSHSGTRGVEKLASTLGGYIFMTQEILFSHRNLNYEHSLRCFNDL